jgi:hypothetical protein
MPSGEKKINTSKAKKNTAKRRTKSNNNSVRGGAPGKSMEPVVGKGALVNISSTAKPVHNSGQVWNKVAMYPSNLANQVYTGPHVINRGIVTPNRPHYSDLVTFGGGSATAKQQKAKKTKRKT